MGTLIITTTDEQDAALLARFKKQNALNEANAAPPFADINEWATFLLQDKLNTQVAQEKQDERQELVSKFDAADDTKKKAIRDAAGITANPAAGRPEARE